MGVNKINVSMAGSSMCRKSVVVNALGLDCQAHTALRYRRGIANDVSL